MKELNIISLGAGVQSTVLALMADQGAFDFMPDHAIFADTQWEPEYIYTHLEWIVSQLSYPVHIVTAGNIKQDHLNGVNTTDNKFSSIPFYSKDGGAMGRRQCTREYKIDPINKKIRELLKLKKYQRMPPDTNINLLQGITLDEATRMKVNRKKWITNRYPLIDKRMYRHDCITWFNKRYPGRKLIKSACKGCPYKNDIDWREMKNKSPDDFYEVVKFDNDIRMKGSTGTTQYIHSSCTPLDDVDLSNAEDNGQVNMFNNECEGMCGL